MHVFFKNILVFPFLILGSLLWAQNHSLLNNFLSVENGLSHNEVTSIVQDKDGFIWIGTRGGLNRYDGYKFQIFNQVPGDSNSLANPSIESLFADSKGNIWIGTKSGGISKYDPVLGQFKNLITNYKKTSPVLPDNRVLCFHEDKNKQIWIGTWDKGLIIYNEEKQSSKQYLGNSMINAIAETADGRIWVGTSSSLYEYQASLDSFVVRIGDLNYFQCNEIHYDEKRNVLWIASYPNMGLVKFDLRNNKWQNYTINDSEPEGLQTIHTYESILLDNNGDIWLGTWGTGFYFFNTKTETFHRYHIYPNNSATLNKDYDAILDIFQDKDNNLWLGTNGGGVVLLTKKLKFNSVGSHPEANKGLVNTRIMSIVDDTKGNLWLGTIGSGLVWSPDKENYYQVDYPEGVELSRFFTIKYLYEDYSENIWVGTSGVTYLIEFENGKPKMQKASNKFNTFPFDRTAVSFLDTKAFFLYGTLQNGLFILDKNKKYSLVKHFIKQEQGELNSDRISYLLQDAKDRIWAGTYNGLHIFNPIDTSINLAENQFKINNQFTGNIITCLAEDRKGNLWIGTPNGLNKLSETGEDEFSVDYFTVENGLASNFIKGISVDFDGNIWCSTNVGISKFEINNQKFINFDESDGVLGKNFTEASSYTNKNGALFFGGTHGLTWFNPNEIEENKEVHRPIFTQLKVLNQLVEPATSTHNFSILEKVITHTPKIELTFHQNNFEIEFSALDYKSGGRNQFSYKLENHDDDWNFIGTRRFVNFNNLKPGDYKLMVKSSNSHNNWNENPREIFIDINPPFWQTWYALGFYILLIIGIVSIIRWNAVKQVRLANNLEMEKLQHEQDQKLNEMKLRFFTNLSHEFRTPLTLILAPLKELLSQKDKYLLKQETENKIGIVQNNALRLMKLVNQLLDFRKVESGNMKLFTSQTNFSEFVAEICHPFFELAEINNIRFKLNSSEIKEKIWIDRDKFEIIINNLISNAFKYIHENGKIEVAIYEEEEEVLLSVSDNGPGIPKTEISQIFDRFYRVNKTENAGSSGIGLALAKRFVDLHRGTISVVSEPNVHTEFTVTIFKGSKHLKPDEMLAAELPEKGITRREQLFSQVLPAKQKINPNSDHCILIVEDNKEVNNYLAELLEPHYCVESVTNGVDGLKVATEKMPNLIISDVMMPQMDGFEFCKRIRANDATSTVPFIFLTAKSNEQFRLLGTQLGADDFISKPFDPNLLLEKVKNILASRKKLQKQYSRSIRLEPSDIEITSAEEVFIEKAIAIVEKNLQNHKFTSDVLASEMNMSNSSLYRKLKSLTNSSTAEFIRSIRIKRAAQLLADKERTITEIAYEIGFNDVKHFRTVFQKQFSCSPSEYREKL